MFNVDWIENDEHGERPREQSRRRAAAAAGDLGVLRVKNALSYVVSGGEIPQLHAPATGEEILMRLTEYRKKAAMSTPRRHDSVWRRAPRPPRPPTVRARRPPPHLRTNDLHPQPPRRRRRQIPTRHDPHPRMAASIASTMHVPAHRLRRPRDHAGHRRLARARERARADGVGRLRDRDACGRGRRRHDDRRHAAELDPADDHASRRSRESGRDATDSARRRRILGRRRPGQPSRARARCSSDGALGFKCFLVHSGVEEFGCVGEPELRARDATRASSARRCSSTRSSRARSSAARRDRATRSTYTTLSRLATARGRGRGDRAGRAAVPGDRRAHSHRSSLVGGALTLCARRARQAAADRGDDAALSALRRGARFPTGDASSSAHRRSANTRIASSSGARSTRTLIDIDRQRSLAVHPASERAATS